ncbi:hypothetical protein [Aestuariivivens sp. NBU2969]|uniref:hypothetical protein n=1 Tax=Aestuariivivens sp. NBU2969 TaxID=2873267 RepID=UPI001CBDD94B|nr:hypothetical protein [Aestuariivivens sp. NBU2969]
MSKRILYIDPISPYGHDNLNKRYISKFIEKGYIVDVILSKRLKEKLEKEIDVNFLWIIPDIFVNAKSKYLFHFYQLLICFRIIYLNKLKYYDHVFFSSFDELVLGLFKVKSSFFLLNHSNFSKTTNFLKMFFLKKLEKKHTFIVLSENIRQAFYLSGFKNVKVDSIGLYKKHSLEISTNNLLLAGRLINFKNYKRVIFIPTGAKLGDNFITSLIKSKKFQDILIENNVLIIVKGSSFTSCANIVNLNYQLNDTEYRTIFMLSDLIVLHYPKEFKYRVSGLLFECFSNNKACLLTRIDSFLDFGTFFNYNPYYSNENELVKKLTSNYKEYKYPYNNINKLDVKLDWI